MDISNCAPSWTTRKQAVAHLAKHIKLRDQRWLIAVDEHGRYVPCVLYSILYENDKLIGKGIAVLR